MARQKVAENLRKTAVIQYRVTEQFKVKVAEQAAARGFGTTSAYIDALVRADMDKE